MSSAAVAIWTVPQRLAEILQRLTNQVNGVLLPVVVDSDQGGRDARLRAIFIQGTRVSLVAVLPLATAVGLLASPLIHAWVGPNFVESIAVTQILTIVVAVRVGNATATTVLKGAGRHRLLALSNAGAAVANLALSLLLIRPYGLVGQAVGTLIPVVTVAVVVLWPAACRRVGLSLTQAFHAAVWPTLWPLAVMAAVVLAFRSSMTPHLWSVAAVSAAGGIGYLATFLAFAIPRDERRVYFARILELAQQRRRGDARAVA
jgi:O-antigen/teichoic acid export membrane protein